jgi:hypothetical protein
MLRADRLRAARRVLVARRVMLSAAAGDVVAVETLLVPPLVERAGWRICLAAGLLLVPVSPMHPLLLLATHPGGSVGLAAGLLAVTGAALVGVAAFLASRLP